MTSILLLALVPSASYNHFLLSEHHQAQTHPRTKANSYPEWIQRLLQQMKQVDEDHASIMIADIGGHSLS